MKELESDMGTEFLTKRQAAELCQASIRSIDKWRQQGLQSVRIGNYVRLERKQLLEWMRQHMEVKGKTQTAEGQEGELK